MVTELDQRVQGERFFAIVDEVDNILIDEARTPLIISGQAEESADKYYQFARIVPRLVGRPEGSEEGGDYYVDLKEKSVAPTEQGISRMEQWLGVENMYDADPTLARHFEQALRAHALYRRDKEYIVKDGDVIEFEVETRPVPQYDPVGVAAHRVRGRFDCIEIRVAKQEE